MIILAGSMIAKRSLKLVATNILRTIVPFSVPRSLLNVIYLNLNSQQKSSFHQRFGKIFLGRSTSASNGTWKSVFCGKTILTPLKTENFWLDWAYALSIEGHDVEVTKTYGALIESPQPIELFIDIGTNYGLHSLLFLVNKIETISFEPNSSCHNYFKEVCELNKVVPNLKPVALGEKSGFVELSYPEQETWLGSINMEVVSDLASDYDLIVEKIELKTLDDYFQEIKGKSTLIKIDAEGSELAILKGASKTIQANKPKIILESRRDDGRIELFDLLQSHSYELYELPWSPISKTHALAANGFMSSSATNFIAIPR